MKLESEEGKKGRRTAGNNGGQQHQSDDETSFLPEQQQIHGGGIEDSCCGDGNNDDSKIRAIMREVALSGRQQDSFMVMEADKIVSAHAHWMEKFPSIKPSFDTFVNGSPEVLRLLSALGVSHFSCKNRDEVRMALESGINPAQILFSPAACGPVVGSHLKHARGAGVETFTFGTLADVTKIALKAPGAKLLFAVQDTGAQSGDNYADLAETARSLDLEIVGAAVKCSEDLDKALMQAKMALEAAREAGHVNICKLDLGDVSATDVDVCQTVARCFGASAGLDMSASAGGALVADCAATCARIIGVRRYRRDDGSLAFTYVINDGVFGSFSRVLFDDGAALSAAPLKDGGTGGDTLHPSDIWGCSGDDLDVLGRHFTLPEMKVGDWIVFNGMGELVVNAVSASAFTAFEVASDKRSCSNDNKKEGVLWLLTHAERGVSPSSAIPPPPAMPSLGPWNNNVLASDTADAFMFDFEDLLQDMPYTD